MMQQAARMGPSLARAYDLHTSEIIKRVTWMVRQHLKHDHLHLCEAMDQDDANFFFGIPPFHRRDEAPILWAFRTTRRSRRASTLWTEIMKTSTGRVERSGVYC